MPWRGAYYYQNRREGARVVSRYVGSGPAARLIAARDAERQRLRLELRQRRADEAAASAALDRIDRDIELLVAGAMVLGGFHAHHGQWRRRRS